ncbi:uncharacterized protein BDZ99DRAFT_263097 [Mytilinidion resinicola]|uniref:Uncharacterized protein n=1 Tax=Mytilinidion resinicola TaxID=574789 RepID=A0A6A6YWC5_9PEZI|nr:uncharacterized protein BDZ99DRAFT_263097 [Mytilinidion resinicola]KAF2812197.1 hypothetical protein BDZ99DRAFT_263097 [Mytilinidion resinicola]
MGTSYCTRGKGIEPWEYSSDEADEEYESLQAEARRKRDARERETGPHSNRPTQAFNGPVFNNCNINFISLAPAQPLASLPAPPRPATLPSASLHALQPYPPSQHPYVCLGTAAVPLATTEYPSYITDIDSCSTCGARLDYNNWPNLNSVPPPLFLYESHIAITATNSQLHYSCLIYKENLLRLRCRCSLVTWYSTYGTI